MSVFSGGYWPSVCGECVLFLSYIMAYSPWAMDKQAAKTLFSMSRCVYACVVESWSYK